MPSLKCKLCGERKVILESGILMCPDCDKAMPIKGKLIPPDPPWITKIVGMGDPD